MAFTFVYIHGTNQCLHSLAHPFREVLASPLVLNVPHRVDWKACSSSQEEESDATKTLRQNFQPFDFTE